MKKLALEALVHKWPLLKPDPLEFERKARVTVDLTDLFLLLVEEAAFSAGLADVEEETELTARLNGRELIVSLTVKDRNRERK